MGLFEMAMTFGTVILFLHSFNKLFPWSEIRYICR